MSCSYNIHTKVKPAESISTEKIPIKVGLYIPPELGQYAVKEEQQNTPITYNFGPAIVDGSKKMLEGIFSNVVMLNSPNLSDQDPGIQGALTVELDNCDVLMPPTKRTPIEVLIRLKYSASDRDGDFIWSETYEGESSVKFRKTNPLLLVLIPVYFYDGYKKEVGDHERAMRLALEDHFNNAQRGIYRSKWWQQDE